jgi:hypothetical protein
VGVNSKYHQSDVVPPIIEQWAPWIGTPTIFAPRVCLKARPSLSLPTVPGIRYGSVSDFAPNFLLLPSSFLSELLNFTSYSISAR